MREHFLRLIWEILGFLALAHVHSRPFKEFQPKEPLRQLGFGLSICCLDAYAIRQRLHDRVFAVLGCLISCCCMVGDSEKGSSKNSPSKTVKCT